MIYIKRGEDVKKILNDIIEKNRKLINQGSVASYIPALANSDPNDIGLCIMDLQGKTYKLGNYNKKFTIQSISKIMSLILAIEDNGFKKVFEKIDYKSTEESFDSLFKLEFQNVKKPANPMINAGAIITTSLIKGKSKEKFNRLLDLIKLVTENKEISYNEEVYQSEKKTGSKNKAMAYLMDSRGFLEEDVEESLDNYFKQCSIEVDVVDLAKIGLFLANRKESDFHIETKKIITSIMATSGMYNFSGEYAAKIGIPSKSGVAGGLVGTVPNKMGIGIYNPILDNLGNPIVGYNIMKDISNQFKLSLY